MVKLKPSLRKSYRHHHDLVNNYRIYVSEMTTDMLFVIITIRSFMTDHRVCNKSSTTGATCGAGTASPSGPPEFTHGFFGGVRVAGYLVFCVVFCRSLFVLLAIVLLVILEFTAHD